MANPHSPNLLLAALPGADYALLSPHLTPLDLISESILYQAGDKITRAYFPHGGAISLVVALHSGKMVGTVMVGRFGLVGGAAAIDSDIAINQAIVQVEGAGSWLDMAVLRKAADKSEAVRSMLVRNKQAALAQAQQSTACNACHTLEERMCRWLMMVRDATGRDAFNLTQECFSNMLGVRRTSVSMVAGSLQRAGKIRYRRGHIELTNLKGLRKSSCECYQTTRMKLNRVLDIRLD